MAELMRRRLGTPIGEGRHLRPLLDRRNMLSRLLCDPRFVPQILLRALGSDVHGELMDPFRLRRLGGDG